jgi:methionyl-tRNA formyltransferase
MAVTVFVGAYAYARQVLEAMPEPPTGIVSDWFAKGPRWQLVCEKPQHPGWSDEMVYLADTLEDAVDSIDFLFDTTPDLVIVAGWRRLVPILAPTVGFHSASLPEYPGRAPVANAILRGDKTLTNTMLWLDEGVDTGDIIDTRTFPIGSDPDAIYEDIGRTSAEMLREHWQGLLDGTAPRTPQDPAKRGPLTPADAWKRLEGGPVTGGKPYVVGDRGPERLVLPDWVESFG